MREDQNPAVTARLHALIDQYSRRRGNGKTEVCQPSKEELAKLAEREAEIDRREGPGAAADFAEIRRRPRIIFATLEQAQNFAAAAGQLFGEAQDAYLCPRSRHGHAHVQQRDGAQLRAEIDADKEDRALHRVWCAATDAATSPDFEGDDEAKERYRLSVFEEARRELTRRTDRA